MATTIDGDVFIRGQLKAGSMSVPSGSVGNQQINLADPIEPEKIRQQVNAQYSQKVGVSTVTERKPIHLAWAGGLLYDVRAGLIVACTGDATVTVDILKNGLTVMSSVIALDESQSDYSSVIGTIDSALDDYSPNDVFEVSVTATAGTGVLGQGLFVMAVFREDAE